MATPDDSKSRKTVSGETDDLRTRKKASVLGGEGKKPRSGPVLAALCILAAAGAAAAFFALRGPGETAAPTAQSAQRTFDGDVVAYPVSTFADGKARHYELADGGRTIRYFVVRSADGVIRAAFDACDVCWPAGKGYVQDGSAMVCVNCGRRFEADRVNDVQGGCNPAPLRREVVDDHLVIQRADILAGAGYFDFEGRTEG